MLNRVSLALGVMTRAIVENRPCSPSFADGVAAQAVMDACQQSDKARAWVNVKHDI